MIQTWRSHFELFYKIIVLISFSAICNSLILEANAQIIPDNTLGNESSVVIPVNATTERIDGGASRGSNLFHSFAEFNIKEGNIANFLNPAGIQTIFSRVTGNNPSRLFGTLGVLGNANLFFINPNGIIFGPNAKLDISGSFIGSTANSIIFPDGSRFSATNPGAAPLLTIDVPVPLGLEFEGSEPGSIINSATLEPEQNLALVGGTVVSTGSIIAPKNVSLLTVGEGIITTVQFDNEGTYLGQVTQPLTEPFQSISSESKLIQLVLEGGETTGLTVDTEGQVSVAGTNTVVEIGDIVTVGDVKAQDFFGGGLIVTDSYKDIKLNGIVDASSRDIFEILDVPKGTYLGNGGNITLIAQGDIIATDSILAKGLLGGNISFSSGGTVSLSNSLEVNVRSGGEGNITINAQNVEMLDGTTLRAGIDAGLGSETAQGGNVGINATESVTLDEGSFITNVVSTNVIGTAGDINITTGSLSLLNGSSLSNSIFEGSQGNAGNININAIDTVLFDNSQSFSTIESNAIGNAGNINITSDTLTLQNGSQLIANTKGIGNAGDININTRTAEINNSLLRSRVDVKTNEQDTIIAIGKGNGGDIKISTESLILSNGTQLDSSTLGEGNAGDININATNTVLFDNGQSFSNVDETAIGNAGDINITTDTLTLRNDSKLIASTQGKGNAGDITLDAQNQISLDGSEIFTVVSTDGIGKGGNITITTGSLSLTNRSQLVAGVDGEGEAGVIRIEARDDISLIGIKPLDAQDTENTAIFNRLEAGGKGSAGDIYITTGSLLLDGAVIQSLTDGEGDAGNIYIDADETITLINNQQARTSSIASFVGPNGIGNAGDVTFNAESVSLQNSEILSSTQGKGDAGNITVNARDKVTLRDLSFLSTSAITTKKGEGGDIIINARSLSLQNIASLFTSAEGQGNAGNIIINVSDSVTLDDRSSFFATVFEDTTGDGGDITINARAVSLSKYSSIGTLTAGNGNAGNIQIKNAESISLSNNSFINAEVRPTAITTQPSNIELNTQKLSLVNNSIITSSTFGQGDAGNIIITAEEVSLDSGRILTQAASRTGGNITLDLQNLLILRNVSQISTTAGTAQAGGDGGNITINSPFIVTSPKENSDITANAFLGNGGNINITTQGIFGLEVRDTLTPFSDITASSAFGLAGNINIDNLGIDPTRGIENLPQEVVNPQVFQGCQVRDSQAISEFYTLGRGGLPSSPDDWLNEEPFNDEGLIPLEIPLNKIPLQINWKEISSNGISLSCQLSVLQK